MTPSEIRNKIYAENARIGRLANAGHKLSVSKFLNVLKEPFVADAVAHSCFLKAQADPEKYPKYAGMSEDEIKQSWDDASEKGRFYGRFLDDYIGYRLDGETRPACDDADGRAFNLMTAVDGFLDKFMKLDGLVFVGRELPVYLDIGDGCYISGRLDALFMCGDALVLIDWKNTENVRYANKFQKLLGPMCRYDDCEINIYSMQLNLYIKSFIDTYKLIPGPSKVASYIVQIRGQGPFDDTGLCYKVHRQSIPYNDKLITECLEYLKMIGHQEK